MSKAGDRLLAEMALLVAGLLARPRRLSRSEKRQQGLRWCSTAPLGYRWFRGRLVPDDEELAVMQRIVSLRDSGESWYCIARRLMYERCMVRGSRDWSVARVRRLHDAAMKSQAAQAPSA